MATKLSRLLNEALALRPLAERLRRTQELHRVYSDAVPSNLSQASQVGYIDGNTLIIIASNGTAAANLRQQLPSLLARLQERQPQITAVRVEVQVGKYYHPPQRKQSRRLPQSGAESLERLAGALPASPLQQAVKRLAGRAGSNQDQSFDYVKERNCGEKDDKKPE